jgi:hypothetical protein
MELIDGVLSQRQVHDLELLIKSLRYLQGFLNDNSNKRKYLFNGCVVDRTYTKLSREFTPARLCIELARTTVRDLIKLPKKNNDPELESVVELKTRLAEHGFALRLQSLYSGGPRKYVLEAGSFVWILEPSYAQ